MIIIKNPTISYKVALGGIISSLCLLLMFLSSIIPAMYIAFPMFAGALMIIMVSEVNWKWAFLTYIAVSLLALFITFDKQAAFVFIILFGHYSIIKYLLNKIHKKWLVLAIKFIIWNACIFGYFFACVYLLGSKELVKEVMKYGKIGAFILVGIGDLTYYLYDHFLDTLEMLFKTKIKTKISPKK